jgi:hypothetical protein
MIKKGWQRWFFLRRNQDCTLNIDSDKMHDAYCSVESILPKRNCLCYNNYAEAKRALGVLTKFLTFSESTIENLSRFQQKQGKSIYRFFQKKLHSSEDSDLPPPENIFNSPLGCTGAVTVKLDALRHQKQKFIQEIADPIRTTIAYQLIVVHGRTLTQAELDWHAKKVIIRVLRTINLNPGPKNNVIYHKIAQIVDQYINELI